MKSASQEVHKKQWSWATGDIVFNIFYAKNKSTKAPLIHLNFDENIVLETIEIPLFKTKIKHYKSSGNMKIWYLKQAQNSTTFNMQHGIPKLQVDDLLSGAKSTVADISVTWSGWFRRLWYTKHHCFAFEMGWAWVSQGRHLIAKVKLLLGTAQFGTTRTTHTTWFWHGSHTARQNC